MTTTLERIEREAVRPGLWLRFRRELAGLPQWELARRLSMTQNSLSQLERGAREPRPGEVERLEAELSRLDAGAGSGAAT